MSLRSQQIKITQKIGWLILRPFLHWFVSFKVDSKIDFDQLNGPLILTANHASYLDSIMIGIAFPFGAEIFPLYFMARDRMMSVLLWGSFLRWLGAFPASKGSGLEESIKKPQELLSSGASVIIFPQGHRYSEFKASHGRNGAAFLALRSNKPILPVGISGLNNFSWKKFFFKKYRVKITVGEPFFLRERMNDLSDVNQGTEIIMGEIGKLL